MRWTLFEFVFIHFLLTFSCDMLFFSSFFFPPFFSPGQPTRGHLCLEQPCFLFFHLPCPLLSRGAFYWWNTHQAGLELINTASGFALRDQRHRLSATWHRGNRFTWQWGWWWVVRLRARTNVIMRRMMWTSRTRSTYLRYLVSAIRLSDGDF